MIFAHLCTSQTDSVSFRRFGNPEQRKGIPSDYFEGVIERYDPSNPDEEGGEVLSSVDGSWVGFVDFDKVSILYCISFGILLLANLRFRKT
jgi:hypothetical protein